MNLRQSAQLEELDRQKIELRRKQHAERLLRIMNERERTIGFDYDYLRHQVDEKRERDAAEAKANLDYDRRFLEEQRVLGRLAREEQRIRKDIRLSDIKFQRTEQDPELSREWDINRPDHLYVQEPVRNADSDPQLSISGVHKFEGEDLTGPDRQRRQREQLFNWYTQQRLEREHRAAKELEEQREWERRYLENDRLREETTAAEKQARKDLQALVDDENLRALEERRQRNAQEKADELAANADEQAATLASAFISESRDQSVGLGGRRVVQDWKGMSDEEKMQAIGERRSQMIADARLKDEEARRERIEEAERQRAAREGLKRERAEVRGRRQNTTTMARSYVDDAETHREEELARREEPFGNQPTDEFWRSFGRSHR
jgi:hypothetical protein